MKTSRDYVRRWGDGVLPLPCPACDRLRLTYGLNEHGNVVWVECGKCVWTSDLESALAPAHGEDIERRWWKTR